MIAHAARAGVSQGIGTGGSLRLPRADGSRLSVLVCPLSQRVAWFPGMPAALVFIGDPERDLVLSEQMLVSFFGLTGAEARLVKALIQGQRLGDYAEANGVSLNTAKTQLQSVFAKTGHSRQADLVRALVSDSVARLASWVQDTGISA